MIRRALDGEVERKFEPVIRPQHRAAGGNLRWCRARDGSRRGHPRRCRSHRGCHGSSGRHRNALFLPLRFVGRWDGSAADKERQSPCRGSPASGRSHRRRCRADRARSTPSAEITHTKRRTPPADVQFPTAMLARGDSESRGPRLPHHLAYIRRQQNIGTGIGRGLAQPVRVPRLRRCSRHLRSALRFSAKVRVPRRSRWRYPLRQRA